MKRIKKIDDMTDAEYETYRQRHIKFLTGVQIVLGVAAVALAIDGFWQHDYYIVILGVAAGIGSAFTKHVKDYGDY